jgi:hypothetical protein
MPLHLPDLLPHSLRYYNKTYRGRLDFHKETVGMMLNPQARLTSEVLEPPNVTVALLQTHIGLDDRI